MPPPGRRHCLPFIILYLLLSLDLQGCSHGMRLSWRRCWWKHIPHHPGNSSSYKLRQFEPLLNTKQVKSINYTSHLSLKKKKKVKSDHRSKFSDLSNWKDEAWKYQGFNGIRTRDLRDTGSMLDQLSCEATHWERGQFVEFIFLLWCSLIKFRFQSFKGWTALFIG